MSKQVINIVKLHQDAKTPELGSSDAAGLDLFLLEHVDIPPGQRALLRTGIAISIPNGMVGLIWPRSKLAAKLGLGILAGVIDSDYRGEVMVSLLNTSDRLVELRKGDKCAQMVIQQHFSWLPMDVVNYLPETDRGNDGVNSMELRL